MGSLLPILIAVVVCGAWFWWHWHFRIQRRRLEALLEWLASGGSQERMEFLNRGSLSALMVPLEKVSTELDRLRAQVREETFNLQSIMGSMEEGVMIVDNRHVLRLVNPSFVRMFQLKHDPVGLTVLHTLRATAVQEMIVNSLQSGEAQSVEFQAGTARAPKHIAAHAVPMADTNGRPSVLTIFRDISRLKQLEEVRREFVANVSHELRTPLSIFHGYVENLLDAPGIERDDLAGILQILRRHSLRLNALLEDLLLLARLEARRDILKLTEIELEPFVRAIAKDWTGKMTSKGVTLALSIPRDLPRVPADPLRLEQVFCNLLENALKYTPDGGKITICARVDGEHFEFRVTDTGTGILPQDLPHIFERFYRADKARTREQGGTGLGLSIVKHIVLSHGGTADAESTYGEGTRIIIRLPSHQADLKTSGQELAA